MCEWSEADVCPVCGGDGRWSDRTDRSGCDDVDLDMCSMRMCLGAGEVSEDYASVLCTDSGSVGVSVVTSGSDVCSCGVSAEVWLCGWSADSERWCYVGGVTVSVVCAEGAAADFGVCMLGSGLALGASSVDVDGGLSVSVFGLGSISVHLYAPCELTCVWAGLGSSVVRCGEDGVRCSGVSDSVSDGDGRLVMSVGEPAVGIEVWLLSSDACVDAYGGCAECVCSPRLANATLFGIACRSDCGSAVGEAVAGLVAPCGESCCGISCDGGVWSDVAVVACGVISDHVLGRLAVTSDAVNSYPTDNGSRTDDSCGMACGTCADEVVVSTVDPCDVWSATDAGCGGGSGEDSSGPSCESLSECCSGLVTCGAESGGCGVSLSWSDSFSRCDVAGGSDSIGEV